MLGNKDNQMKSRCNEIKSGTVTGRRFQRGTNFINGGSLQFDLCPCSPSRHCKNWKHTNDILYNYISIQRKNGVDGLGIPHQASILDSSPISSRAFRDTRGAVHCILVMMNTTRYNTQRAHNTQLKCSSFKTRLNFHCIMTNTKL